MRRVAWVLWPVACLFLMGTSCYETVYIVGVTPHEGATSVSRDGVFRVALPAALDPQQPALAPGFRLEDVSAGVEIPLSLTVEDGGVTLRTDEPLEADHDFVLHAGLGTGHSWHVDRERYRRVNTRQVAFSTGGAPRALAAFGCEQPGVTDTGGGPVTRYLVDVVFSEPMDVEAVAAALSARSFEGAALAVESVTRREGQPHVVQAVVRDLPARLEVASGVSALGGKASGDATELEVGSCWDYGYGVCRYLQGVACSHTY